MADKKLTPAEEKMNQMAEEYATADHHPTVGNYSNPAWKRDVFVYKAGMRAALALPEVQALVEALEFYSKGHHFEWCGKDDFAPENPSGEPINFESGGAEGSEFNLENGGFARVALTTWRKFVGTEEGE